MPEDRKAKDQPIIYKTCHLPLGWNSNGDAQGNKVSKKAKIHKRRN